MYFSRYVAGSTSAGLLIVSQNLDLRQAIEQILLIWEIRDSPQTRDRSTQTGDSNTRSAPFETGSGAVPDLPHVPLWLGPRLA